MTAQKVLSSKKQTPQILHLLLLVLPTTKNKDTVKRAQVFIHKISQHQCTGFSRLSYRPADQPA